MSRKKTDIKKIKEKRCIGHDADYVPWIKSNEAKSTATATIIRDPINGRAVHTLSKGECNFYWELRYDPNVREIREQYALLDVDSVKRIAKTINGYRAPVNILTTDFMVDYYDGKRVAYSIKWKKSEFSREANPNKYETLIKRQYLEKKYWNEKGVEFKLIFSSELNPIIAENLSTIFMFYDEKAVKNDETLFMYLIAHHRITVPMDQLINFEYLITQKKYKNKFLEEKKRWKKSLK